MTCSCRIKVTRVYAVLKCHDFMSHSSEQKKNKPRGRGQEQLLANATYSFANAILIDFFQNLCGFTAGHRNGMGATIKVQKVSLGVAGNPGHEGKVG